MKTLLSEKKSTTTLPRVFMGMNVPPSTKKKLFTIAKLEKVTATSLFTTIIDKAFSDYMKEHSSKQIDLETLLKLPSKERSEILRQQSILASKDYEVIEDGFDIIE